MTQTNTPINISNDFINQTFKLKYSFNEYEETYTIVVPLIHDALELQKLSTTLPPYLTFYQYIDNGVYKVKVVCNSTSQGVYETVKNIQFDFFPLNRPLTFQEVVFSYPVNVSYTKK